MIHIDPRFTRTSATSDKHVPIRAGSGRRFGRWTSTSWSNELQLLQGLRRRYADNAATIINDDYRDPEDLDGLFSGYDEELGSYKLDPRALRGAPGEGTRHPGLNGTQNRATSTATASRSAPPVTSTAPPAPAKHARVRRATMPCRIRAPSSRSSKADDGEVHAGDGADACGAPHDRFDREPSTMSHLDRRR